MIEKLKRFSEEEQAVSPVIGVILMVAITVILSAVIATFVLGLGEQIGNPAPSASFDYDYDSANGNVTITHQNGQQLDGDKVSITVEGDGDVQNDDGFGSGDVTAGDSAKVTGASDGDVIRVVWEDEGSSAILSERTL